jgi:hypothetical protein
MRTTIRLDDQLLADAKQLAARTGRTLTDVISDALREAVARSSRPERPEPFRMITFAGNGVQPGVDLSDSAALLDLMERGDRPR